MLANLDIIQKVAVIIFLSYYAISFLFTIIRRNFSVLGTLGTVVTPALVVVLILFLDIQFYFTNHQLTEIIGAVLLLSGIPISVWAIFHLGHNKDDFWIAKKDARKRTLITSGPYTYVRHPIYTGVFLNISGLLILFAHPITIVLATVYFAVIIFTAIAEERFLGETLENYNNYAGRTGRFFPKWW